MGILAANGDLIFLLAGVLLACYAAYLTHRKIDVTAGQALIFALAAAFAFLPQLADFEWTGDGFKFTTREQGSQLADQVTSLVEQQIALQEGLRDIGSALEAANARMDDLAPADPTGDPNESGALSEPLFQPDLVERLVQTSAAGIEASRTQLRDVEQLREALAATP